MTDGGDGDWSCANVLSWFVRSCLSVDWWHYQSLLYMYLESSHTALYIRNMSDSIIWCCQDERREKSGDWPHLREGETERRYKWCDGRRLSVSRAQAVLELTPPAGLSSPWPGSRSAVHLNISPVNLTQVTLVLALLASTTLGARKLRGNSQELQEPRDERSLVNTFPFNARGGHSGHAGHNNQRQLFTDLPVRDARQRNRGNGKDVTRQLF